MRPYNGASFVAASEAGTTCLRSIAVSHCTVTVSVNRFTGSVFIPAAFCAAVQCKVFWNCVNVAQTDVHRGLLRIRKSDWLNPHVYFTVIL